MVENLTLDSREKLFFVEEEPDRKNEISIKKRWKLLIVDDDPEVHKITKLVLQDFIFEGKPLEFISAYSGEEAKRVFTSDTDIAVILLDVVMEDDDSGLMFVKYVRNELKNYSVRIILRTGQPGQAPELRVIIDYDINDYKEKTELTAEKLYSTIVTSLRSYRDLQTISMSQKGLEKIIQSSASIFKLHSKKKFVVGILTQLASIINLNKNNPDCAISGLMIQRNESGYQILASTGCYSNCVGRQAEDILPSKILCDLKRAYHQKKNLYSDDHIIVFLQSIFGTENMIYFDGIDSFNNLDKYFTEVFCANVSIAFDNLLLNKEIENTQKEIIFTLGEIAEARSKETGNHVKRVAEYSKLLALKYGLPEDEAEIIRMAAPMHDIGKLGIPDSILNKPGRLTFEEFETIKTHCKIGYEMLSSSNRRIMEAAAIIALHHHEKFNGTGYPQGLKGDEIKLHGRIVAVADVFDAVGNERVYKKAWELDRILELFRNERGEHFDPMLVDIFFDNLPGFLKIKETFPERE
jgi:response regulator RpfG family c-di-GMP phosphodiesterase